ncbi:MAG: Mov34/MPN/PAD-1 family protein [Oscillospiraceae bacterium]|nr:Mov34/MPN/PAD-1 family protein [Oscillospiraceae bacterium]
MQIVFSKRAYLSVVSEVSRKTETETGGTFLGCHESGTWYVIETIEPGPNSVYTQSSFEYDQEYTERVMNEKALSYKSDMTLIGLWHSHLGSLDVFSTMDDEVNSEYAKLTENGAISVIVNIDPVFRMTAFHVTWPLMYSKLQCFVDDSLFPEHLLRRNSEP